MNIERFSKSILAALTGAAFLVACGDDSVSKPEKSEKGEPFASQYKVAEYHPVLIKNATVLTATGKKIEKGSVLFADGKIVAVGTDIDPPADDNLQIIDAEGKWVTPGLIDVHSHLGVYPAPGVQSSADGNEMTSPVTADVWAEHSVWPQDPQFQLALAGGVTSLQILPGSANLVGGRGVTLKNVAGRSVMEMKFPNAPYGLKMACGENPKRVYGSKGQAPMTRMGNVAGYRKSWIDAKEYMEKWDEYEAGKGNGKPPKRDLRLESLAGVLRGEILIQNHCYRADEMMVMMDIAKEFDFKVTTFHHAVESYKIADKLAENDVCSAMWSDWWGFKQEAYDMVESNVALVDKAGACAVVHSDSATVIQHLNKEAAKAMTSGNRIGMNITPAHAIKWITINAAKAIGVDDQTGSLEEGKMADVVLWDGNPFSVYTKAEKVYVDGALMFDRKDQQFQPASDFELGIIDLK
ncbi:amidohydrolase [Kangiella sediminilitoris]|uniref:Amidohydrolase n=1 Tax=Kangiella sediminilitoris TaxID=1144748 RepID=A0A1B3BAT2_9GAMM|nr:amidohydrolase [Kangiella sediminilitoris]AOE49899.1 amidohydrolase [Kangiella sediminilitoris]